MHSFIFFVTLTIFKILEIFKKLMAKIGLFDLEEHFAFYGAYHSNPMNVFIHMMFVWPILFTFLVILYFTPPLVHLSLPYILIPNFGFLLTVIFAGFYVCLDVKAGSFAGLLCFVYWVFGSFVAHQLGFSLAWKVVLVTQLFCWAGQFIGHGVYEKRTPAFLDNLAQAFLTGPFFVLLEARVFMLVLKLKSMPKSKIGRRIIRRKTCKL